MSIFIAIMLLLLGIYTTTAAVPASDCLPGDLPCACAAIGGTWRELQGKAPLQPTCTFEFMQKVNGKGDYQGCSMSGGA
jgi:hypothetical protein